MAKKYLLFTILFIFLIFKTFAWGYKGHQLVAEIAKSCLKKKIIDSVQFYLGEISFEKAAVWMDEIKSDSKYDYLKPMHYINVEKDKTYVKVNDANIINELDLVISELRNKKLKSKEEIKNNLLILFHLVGDLHQPLHVGYGEDKGGNTILFTYKNNKTNLHRIWDTNIIDESKLCYADCKRLKKRVYRKEKKVGEINTSLVWMNESRLLLNTVYDYPQAGIDSVYIKKNTALVKTQIIRAGVRLAIILQSTFNK